MPDTSDELVPNVGLSFTLDCPPGTLHSIYLRINMSTGKSSVIITSCSLSDNG